MRTGTNVMSLDTEARTAKLQGGDEVGFEKALLAPGSNVNILRVARPPRAPSGWC